MLFDFQSSKNKYMGQSDNPQKVVYFQHKFSLRFCNIVRQTDLNDRSWFICWICYFCMTKKVNCTDFYSHSTRFVGISYSLPLFSHSSMCIALFMDAWIHIQCSFYELCVSHTIDDDAISHHCCRLHHFHFFLLFSDFKLNNFIMVGS